MNSDNLIYYYISFFMVYSFIGWCVEVIFAAWKSREFSNRGFLNGPVCPIYGFGVVIILGFLSPFKDQVLKLFIFSTILVSTLEYVVGLILEKLFHHKWWDYSDMKFNIKGYISLRFSIMWGLGCVIIVRYVHPLIEVFISKIPLSIGYISITLLLACLLIDTYMTVLSINGLNRRLKRLEEITQKLKSISNELGENLYETTTNVLERNDKLKVKVENRRASFDALVEEQRIILTERKFTHRRLLKAFPRMRSKKFTSALKKLRDHVSK